MKETGTEKEGIQRAGFKEMLFMKRKTALIRGLKKDTRPVSVDVSCMVYNHGPYLRQALDGIFMQRTSFPVRVIIHEDASTDDSASIIREYEKRYPGRIISVMEEENQYQQGNSLWLIMFPHFTSKYIACCEGDDYWTDPDKLQKQVDYLENNPDCSAVYHNILPVDEFGVYNEKLRGCYPRLKEGDYQKREIRKGKVKTQTASMVRRNYYPWMSERDKQFFAEAKCNLDEKNLILCGIVGRVHYLPDVMAAHRRVLDHGDSYTAAKQKKTKLERFLFEHGRYLEKCRLYEYFSGEKLYIYDDIIADQEYINRHFPDQKVNICEGVPFYAHMIYRLHTRGKPAPSEKTRESNIELFRIVAMLLIVAHHFVVNSGLTAPRGPIYSDPLSWRSLFLLVLGAWGKTGTNCFVMITGYYMCKSRITIKKFAKLVLEVMFYKLVINSVFWITGYESFTLDGLFMIFIPIRTVSNDFLNAFLLFYLLIPFLNILVRHMDRKQHFLLLLWCGFTYIFLGTVPGFSVQMNYISWFSVLFMIASYIRLYPRRLYQDKKLWAWLTVSSVLLAIISVFFCAWLSKKTGKNVAYSYVSDANTFLAAATGVCAFMLFKNMNIKHSRLINTVASSAFGVVLIHGNSDTMRRWLWTDTLDVVGHYNSRFMPLYAAGCIAAVYIVCTLIDQLRIRGLEKPLFKVWDRHRDGVLEKLKRIKMTVRSRIRWQE